jgi:hypothetical protein
MVLGDPDDPDVHVGIGTSIPGTKLHVITNGPHIGILGEATTTGTGIFAKADQSGGFALYTDGSSFFAGDTTPFNTPSLYNGVVIGSINPTAPDSVAYLFAFDYGRFQSHTLALNHPGGRVGIGTTTPDQTLTVNGDASKLGGGSWQSYSDERLKDLKADFSTGLEAVMQLQPIRYEYKQNNSAGIKSEGEHIGFSAQAVQKVVPEAVVQDDKGYLLVNNDPILWTMLNAIKEQQKEIEQLRKEVQEMRAGQGR